MTVLGPFRKDENGRDCCTFCGGDRPGGYFTAAEVRDQGRLLTAFTSYRVQWQFRETDPLYCEDCCEDNATKNDGEEGHVYEYDRDRRDWCCRYCDASAPNDFYNDW